jgi:hypothetical protein
VWAQAAHSKRCLHLVDSMWAAISPSKDRVAQLELTMGDQPGTFRPAWNASIERGA